MNIKWFLRDSVKLVFLEQDVKVSCMIFNMLGWQCILLTQAHSL